ncbi:hypothetical protein MYSTI_03937 [Myxococcus stipitatus DSM 14675]|uniref:Right handed beta helix domain-containing protein n=1 Tax=Myxococcus stipitatus (strain DSM 14675 / JCM 12634 / Mx s8) TaxID=1278073 RepID=L7UB07_MYXSD|nr:right-handed parallel beta-helix repeat-containing protein [Myxococcus stipitatus]AGC45243.1 hypothetical protein MYSTI_03937 [Myxococcus stipitatus DSM 14675]
MSKPTYGLLILSALWIPAGSLAEPVRETVRTLYVANNAVDSAACGTRSNPCRSISEAISHALPGERILVGPGRYGDLNSDGDFDDPGEEAAEVATGCRCMILIDKPLQIVSSAGAERTVLDANGAVLDVVNITASEVTFGGPNRGFTLTGAGKVTDDDGIGLDSLGGRNVRVIDNIAQGNGDDGFRVWGDEITVKDNLSLGNGSGMTVTSESGASVVTGNIATDNGKGPVHGHGFTVWLKQGTVKDNHSVGNRAIGFLIFTSGPTQLDFTGNVAIGNRGAGLWLRGDFAPGLHGNSFYGNLGEPVGGAFQSVPNCGVVNDTSLFLDATLNYWGASTGPGGDPADAAGAGSVCDVQGQTQVIPFDASPLHGG